MTYTKGPWGYGDGEVWLENGTTRTAQVYGPTAIERDANGKLISAAPELLEACKATLRAEENGNEDDYGARINLLRAAINKAEGKV